MTGLLFKDFMIMRKTLRSYLIIIVFYVVLAQMHILNYGFILSFIQIMLAVVPLSIFAYDEQAKWDRYAMSLPIGRSAVVRARYLFLLVLCLFAWALGLIGCAFLWALHAGEVLETLLTLMVTSAIYLLVPTFLVPLSYKLGSERARPFLYAIVFIPVILLILLYKMEIISFDFLVRLEDLPPATLLAICSLFPLGGLAALLVSYFVSCRVVAGKEY